ncbi:MAG: glycosyltransferase family 4 protein [Verrucomicrobia bacterium]|nr:glycosyltransferase family 4 protein [Verrucomicrobiota bacterium]MBU1910427.1 glycosyltransferase family 4 protein [Verrucomicrobiota bacterium]
MRILFITHYFPPEGNAPANRVFEMTRRWAAAGHPVTVITGVPNVPNGVPYPGYRNRLYQVETKDGVEVRRVWTFLAPNRGTIRRTLNYLSFMVSALLAGLFVPRPDVVIATSPQFFCGWAGVWMARLRRRPFILEIRDLWPESIEAVGAMRRGLALRFVGWLEQRLYRAARHMVTVGDGYRDRLVARGVPAGKITVIPNGFVPDAPPPEADVTALRKQYGLEGRFVCAYIGTIGMACGLDVVLRAAARLKGEAKDEFRFLLVGDGAIRADLERRRDAEGLAAVVFAGLQPRERILLFLAASDACLVHLRKNDLFKTVLPSKMLEAMAAGKPVVLGVEGAAAELLKRSGAGICIEPENETDLLKVLESWRGQQAERARMSEAGPDYIRRFHDPALLAAAYLNVLEGTVVR